MAIKPISIVFQTTTPTHTSNVGLELVRRIWRRGGWWLWKNWPLDLLNQMRSTDRHSLPSGVGAARLPHALRVVNLPSFPCLIGALIAQQQKSFNTQIDFTIKAHYATINVVISHYHITDSLIIYHPQVHYNAPSSLLIYLFIYYYYYYYLWWYNWSYDQFGQQIIRKKEHV